MSAASTASPDFDRHRHELVDLGYTIVEHAISDEAADEVLAELYRLEEQYAAEETERIKDRQSLRSWCLRDLNLLARAETVRKLALNETVAELTRQVLGPDYLLTDVVSNVLGPGDKRQSLHHDDLYYALALGHPHVPLACNTIWALTDFTRENGATRLVPGSHKFSQELPMTSSDPDPLPEGREFVYAEMPKGSVLVLEGAVWHGGCENRTADERRAAVLINHCAGWLRPEHNNLLAMPLDQVKGLDPRLQELMGFGTYKGIIGRIDGQNPMDLLGLR